MSDDLDFEPSGFFALRTPLLSFQEILRWTAAGADEDSLRRPLVDAFARREVREAIFLASPKLESNIDRWLTNADDRKVHRALIRYFVRMSARPTPFGTFAGTSVGRIAERTELRLTDPSRHRRKTRLDMHYLSALAQELSAPPLVQSLTWFPNTSLYEVAGRLRFVEARHDDGIRRHRLVAIEPSEGVVTALATADGGASFDEIVGALVGDDVTRTDAAAFVVALIEAQVLVSDLEPSVTGPEAIDSMLDTLGSHEGAAAATAVLQKARAELGKIDRAGLGAPSETYRDLARSLEELPAPIDPSRLFQVDLVPGVESAELGRDVVDAIARAIEALRRATPAPDNDALSRFRSDFAERYETREVPLVEALDEEIGIGFEASRSPTAEASPLLAGLPFTTGDADAERVGPGHALLLRKLEEAWATGATEVVLEPRDLEALASERPIELPDAFGALCTIAAEGPGPIACLNGATGPSGGILLGRFCLADPHLAAELAGHLAAEEKLQADTVFAEIVHLPEGRIGNILARPVMRSHEIPFLGRSGAPPTQHIPITDLLVSVRGDRITLRSRRLDKEVLPRLTSAHNYSLRSPGIYRFLCALQAQHAAGGVVWRWGTFERARFLPRLVIGRVVVSRARWIVDRDDFDAITDADPARALAAVQDLRSRWNLPRFAALQDQDNELVIDLDNELAVDTLVDLVRRRRSARLVEMWPQPERLCVEGPSGAFTNEVVVPFVRKSSARTMRPLPARPPADIDRTFPPGSEWLYVKLYTGTATADRLLREIVAPFVREVADGGRGRVDRWFFIRYGDPRWHLRLRLHGDAHVLGGEVLPLLRERCAGYFDDGSLWRLQLDTYEREVERYGGPDAIAPVEEIFRIDSEAALRLLELLPGDAWMDARWRLALGGVDSLLADIGLDPEQRRTLARNVRDGFAREFDASVELKRGIGMRYRDVRSSLEALLEGGSAPGIPPEAASALEERSRALRGPAADLRALEERGRLGLPLPEVAASLAHMHVNRLLRSAHRAHELVIYDLLARLYEAQAARNRSR